MPFSTEHFLCQLKANTIFEIDNDLGYQSQSVS